jgi:hypothetical protein
MSVEEAARILAAARVPATPGSRKRRRRYEVEPQVDRSPEQDEEQFVTVGIFQPVHWQNLIIKARVHWARYFCFADEDTINSILKEAMGVEIMAFENVVFLLKTFTPCLPKMVHKRHSDVYRIETTIKHDRNVSITPPFLQGYCTLDRLTWAMKRLIVSNCHCRPQERTFPKAKSYAIAIKHGINISKKLFWFAKHASQTPKLYGC